MARQAVRNVDVPTIDDMDQGMSTPAGGWRLYSARDDWFRFEYNSIPYYIPPDKDGMVDEHPVKDDASGEPVQVACNGELRIDDRVGHVYAVSPSGGPTSKQLNNRKVYESARDIVRFAVRTYGDRGITFMTGDERSDEIRKGQAKQQYLSAQVAADLYVLQSWDEQIANWKKRPMNAGQPLPTPPELVRLARERLDLRDAKRRGLSRSFKHNCTLCGSYATDDDKKFDLHLAVNHGQGEIKDRTEAAQIASGTVPGVRARGKARRPEARA